MGWSIGYDRGWDRDIGYGVPAECDHPKCKRKIDRGLSYVCGGEPYGGEDGCGLYFCEDHLTHGFRGEEEDMSPQLCERCAYNWELPENSPYEKFKELFAAKPDIPRWIRFKLKDPSWALWRADNPRKVRHMESQLKASTQ